MLNDSGLLHLRTRVPEDLGGLLILFFNNIIIIIIIISITIIITIIILIIITITIIITILHLYSRDLFPNNHLLDTIVLCT